MRFRLGVLLAAGLLSVAIFSVQAQLPTARLRTAHYVIDAPAVDVYVDGEQVAEGLVFRRATEHLELEAGDHTVIFVETGGEPDAPLFEAVEVTLVGGVDYTLAAIGQVADESLQPLLIDETAAVAEIRDPGNPSSYAILLHGISDGPAIDMYMDGELQVEALEYTEYAVIAVSLEPHDIEVTFSGDREAVIFQNKNETSPDNGLVLLTVMLGAYPDNLAVSGAVSRLPDRSIIDFLGEYAREEGVSFNTLLAAIETAGLADSISTEGAFTLLAPTDAAFAALPADVLETLLADPVALADVLNLHLVDAVFTTRDIEEPLTLTTRQGSDITVSATDDGFTINSANILFGGFPVVTNGNVIAIDAVLLPEE